MTSKLITVATFPDLASAGLAKSILEENDIYAFLPNESFIGIRPNFAPAFDGVQIQVQEDVSERAIALLAEHFGD